LFTFCGTFEKTSSPSVHNQFHNAVKMERKFIYAGPGAKTTNPISTIKVGATGTTFRTQSDENEQEDGIRLETNVEMAFAEAQKQYGEGVRTFFIQGWSRGAVSAIILANMLAKTYNESSANDRDKVTIVCVPLDPVAGVAPATWKTTYSQYMKMESKLNLKFLPIYAQTETSIGFAPLKPGNNVNYMVLPANHQMLVGLAAVQSGLKDDLLSCRPQEMLRDRVGSCSPIITSILIQTFEHLGLTTPISATAKMTPQQEKEAIEKDTNCEIVQAAVLKPAFDLTSVLRNARLSPIVALPTAIMTVGITVALPMTGVLEAVGIEAAAPLVAVGAIMLAKGWNAFTSRNKKPLSDRINYQNAV
jgi:hypothetical protein